MWVENFRPENSPNLPISNLRLAKYKPNHLNQNSHKKIKSSIKMRLAKQANRAKLSDSI